MSLDKELREADELKIAKIFTDMWGTKKLDPSTLNTFISEERRAANERYPVLNVVRLCLVTKASELIKSGFSKEELAHMMLGMTMMSTVIAAYASSEAPDTPDETQSQ